VTTWFDEAEVIDPLGAFAELPDWLAAAMLPEQVAASLRRHVPELAEGEKTLLPVCHSGCAPKATSGWPGTGWM
jgi:hypothetical protein